MSDKTAIGDMDWDGDGTTNAQEWTAGTNPLVAEQPPAPRPVGMSEDMAKNLAEVRRGAEQATKDFEKSIDEADGVSEMISAVGTYIKDIAGPVGDVGEGIGDSVEEAIAKGFGSEGVGTGLLSETGEAVFAVLGEGAEAIAEMTGGLGDAMMRVTGGVIDTVGDIGTDLGNAGSALLDGDIGEAFGYTGDAIKSGVGLVNVAVDTGAALLEAGGEFVEGVVETGVEAVEGVGEMTIGLGRNIVDAGEAIGGVVADGAEAVADVASDAYDAVSDAASDAYDAVSDFFSY
jgi:hypothetical protein